MQASAAIDKAADAGAIASPPLPPPHRALLHLPFRRLPLRSTRTGPQPHGSTSRRPVPIPSPRGVMNVPSAPRQPRVPSWTTRFIFALLLAGLGQGFAASDGAAQDVYFRLPLK